MLKTFCCYIEICYEHMYNNDAHVVVQNLIQICLYHIYKQTQSHTYCMYIHSNNLSTQYIWHIPYPTSKFITGCIMFLYIFLKSLHCLIPQMIQHWKLLANYQSYLMHSVETKHLQLQL